MFQHFLRRRPLYPTELRGLIQKIFNFAGLQDSNDSIFRRRTLYPGEVRGHIQKLLNFSRLRDSNGSIVRRRPLYPTELRGLIQKIFNFAGLQDSKDSISRKAPLLPSFKCPGPSLCEEQRYYSILCWKEQRQFCLWPVRSCRATIHIGQ